MERLTTKVLSTEYRYQIHSWRLIGQYSRVSAKWGSSSPPPRGPTPFRTMIARSPIKVQVQIFNLICGSAYSKTMDAAQRSAVRRLRAPESFGLPFLFALSLLTSNFHFSPDPFALSAKSFFEIFFLRFSFYFSSIFIFFTLFFSIVFILSPWSLFLLFHSIIHQLSRIIMQFLWLTIALVASSMAFPLGKPGLGQKMNQVLLRRRDVVV